jgi:hypothetical protein
VWGNPAQLERHAQVVAVRPVLDYLSVGDAQPVRLGAGEALAGRRKRLLDPGLFVIPDEGADVAAGHRAMHRHEIAFGHHLVDVPAQLGVGVAQPQRRGVRGRRAAASCLRWLVASLVVQEPRMQHLVELLATVVLHDADGAQGKLFVVGGLAGPRDGCGHGISMVGVPTEDAVDARSIPGR